MPIPKSSQEIFNAVYDPSTVTLAVNSTGGSGATEIEGVDAENAAVTAKPVLTGGRYDASARTLDDGDAGALALNASGHILTAGAGASETDDSAFTPGTTEYTPTGGTFTTDLVDAGDGGAFKMSAKRELFVAQDTAGDLNVTEANSTAILADTASIDTTNATIAGDTTSLDGKVTACNTGAVTISAALPAGTNAIGKLAANTGVDIGDVDVTSVPAPLSTTGGGTEATALRVTVANNSTGVLTVDNAGTFATQATLQAGTAEFGKLAAGVAEIGNVKNSGTFAVQNTPVALAPDANQFQATITSADATTATQVKAKTAAKKIHVTSLIISTDTAMSIQLQDDTGPTVLMEQVYLAANGGMAMNFPEATPLIVNTNEDLDVLASAAGNISVTVTGYVV